MDEEYLERLRALLRMLAEKMEGLVYRNFSDHGEGNRLRGARNKDFHGILVEMPLVFEASYWYDPHGRVLPDQNHRQILHVLENGDPERAENIMREHFHEGRDAMVAQSL